MPIYKCEKCNKEFSQRSHYTQHTKRKTSCVRGSAQTSASNSLEEPTPATSPENSPEQSPENSPQQSPEQSATPTRMSITTASCASICRHYDTVLNVDKTTYVSTNDEPTPMKCVKELIDSIPADFWSSPDLRILDPCCGNGNFGVHIYHKLIDHHEPHIVLQNMLEFNDINAQRLDNVREMFDAANYQLQITQHDFLNPLEIKVCIHRSKPIFLISSIDPLYFCIACSVAPLPGFVK